MYYLNIGPNHIGEFEPRRVKLKTKKFVFGASPLNTQH